MQRMEEATPDHPLKQIRTHVDMTGVDFAVAIDTTGPYLSNIENRKQDVGHRLALRIQSRFPEEMRRLGITVEDLLRGGRV